MIERATVDGKPATVAYIDDKFNPVEKAVATLIKVRWDDGEQVILSAKEPPQTGG